MNRIAVLTTALLAVLALPVTAQARRFVDDVVDALRRIRRGERVRLPRFETYEHRILRGADGKFRSWDDLMRPGEIDTSLPPFRRLVETGRLDEGLKAVIRSDPRESARLLGRYGGEGADLLRRLGREGVALNRHLDDELADTVRAVEKGAAELRATGRAVEEMDHAKGLLNVGKKMGKEGLRFVRENWKALVVAGVLGTLYLHPEVICGPMEKIGHGVREMLKSIMKGIFYNPDGSPSYLAFSLAGLGGMAFLAWLASVVYPWIVARRMKLAAARGWQEGKIMKEGLDSGGLPTGRCQGHQA